MKKKNNKYQIDIIVEARMDSTRLPGKVMLPAVGKPMLKLMIERLKNVDCASNIIIATTTKPIDDQIVKLVAEEGVLCYRGSEDDVLGRVLESAIYYGTDLIVEVTGDNPLSDPHVIAMVVDKYMELDKEIDFVSNDVGCYNDTALLTFPLGLNVKVFKASFLSKIEKKAKNPVDREHVVNYVLKNMEMFNVYNYEAVGVCRRPELRFTMDYNEDYLLIKRVFEQFYFDNKNFTAHDIIEFLDSNRAVKSLNEHCVQNRYGYD